MPDTPISIVTGANTGIGRITAETLARQGHHVVLACRSESKTRPVVDGIVERGGKAEFLALDLADLREVARAAASLRERGRPVRLLINNAGLAGHRGVTAQGFELTFGVNHLGTFAFTRALLPLLENVQDARVVTVASRAHYQAKDGIPWDRLRESTRTTTGMAEYQVSKLCNVLFAAELARRTPGLVSVSLHPGVVATEIWRRIPWPFGALAKLFMISEEEGARTSLHCATSADVSEQSGAYFDRCAVKRPSALSADTALAAELWQRSEAWVDEHTP